MEREQARKTSVRDFLFTFWPALLAVLTVVFSCAYNPDGGIHNLSLSFNASRIAHMAFSPFFLSCLAASLVGIGFARHAWSGSQGYGKADKMIMIWFLMNAVWFHTGCDVLSGLFQVMPNMTDCYIASNNAHTLPVYQPGRIYLDAVYWFELCAQFPLSLLTFVLYIKKSRFRPLCETTVSCFQISGTVLYYLPNILMGRTDNAFVTNMDRAIASLWIVVPLILTIRNARHVRQNPVPRTVFE